jgi:hypothetical protein
MRHLFVARFPLCLLACALLCSCATAWGPNASVEDEALESFLDSGPPGVMCEGTRLVGATTFSATCLPVDSAPRLTVVGLEPLPTPLRECVLASLPVETGPGEPTACQQGAAQVLQGRLRQLGWLEASVAPGSGSPNVSEAQLTVRLGSRYQVGQLRIERTEEGGIIEPQRILARAYAATPEGSWYTTSALAQMHAGIYQMKKFRAVWIIGGEPDAENKVVPVTIDVWEKPHKPPKPKHVRQERPRVPDHCPRRGAICVNGRDCTFNYQLGCAVCVCRPACW